MSNCQQTLCFQLKCNCQHQQQPYLEQPVSADPTQAIYSKFAHTLQQQLRNQHLRHSAQVDELNSQLFNNKNNILKLQLRNKKDLDAYEELRKQYNALLLKFKNQDSKSIRQVQVIEKIKQVPVQVANDDLKDQVLFWKNKYEEIHPKIQRLKLQNDNLHENNQNLLNQNKKLKKIISKLENQALQLKKIVQDQERNIEKANQHIQFLKNNKQIVVETKHLFPQFKAPQKVRTQTKVQTVYVQKPVEKLVFVDVEKKVKEFIQPERAVVNRVISCQPSKNCKCDDNQGQLYAYKTQIANLHNCIDELEHNVNSYKDQRNHLVDVISNKNTELNYLQSKMKLFGSNDPPVRMGGSSTVNVQVSKIKNTQSTSPKGFVKTQNKKR